MPIDVKDSMSKKRFYKMLNLIATAIPPSLSNIANPMFKRLLKDSDRYVEKNNFEDVNTLVVKEDSCAELSRLHNLSQHLKNKLESTNENADPSFRAKVRINRLLKRVNTDLDKIKILDLGCGKGAELIEIKKLFPGAECYGLDVIKNTPNSYFKYIEVSSSKLPFEDRSIDLIISFEAFEHFENVASTINECVRVLKPYGKLYAEFGGFWNTWGGRSCVGSCPMVAYNFFITNYR